MLGISGINLYQMNFDLFMKNDLGSSVCREIILALCFRDPVLYTTLGKIANADPGSFKGDNNTTVCLLSVNLPVDKGNATFTALAASLLCEDTSSHDNVDGFLQACSEFLPHMPHQPTTPSRTPAPS